MIYLLLAAAGFALFVWAGRRARPMLARPEWRIAAGTLSALVLAAGGFAAARGAWPAGLGLGALGLVMALTARRGALPGQRADDASLAEAREILGVAAGATRAEIQAAYGRLIRAVHPDVGGTSGLAARLNAARDALLKK
jgi:hypothetical protein